MHFDAKRMGSRCVFRLRALWLPGALLFGLIAQAAETNGIPEYPAPTPPGNTTSAWKFAQASFEWAEFATDDTQRATLADEGIAAARFAVEMDPKNPAGHFYLAMNKGQLARTKSLGALPLVKEMEESFLRSIKLDPAFDHASAHRSLGMLYLDAPGWPASIGNKSKARKHLEKAVEIAPDYPTNPLTLMDALLRWSDKAALIAAMNRYRRILPKAREKYSGGLWENSWRNWDADWKRIVKQSSEL
jgi:tetratricopeptide (TPR) repeat protein